VFSRFFFLAPNTTSVIQAADQGVIHSLKAGYKREVIKFILTSTNSLNCNTHYFSVFDVHGALRFILCPANHDL
jgi:hypothetical protein